MRRRIDLPLSITRTVHEPRGRLLMVAVFLHIFQRHKNHITRGPAAISHDRITNAKHGLRY